MRESCSKAMSSLDEDDTACIEVSSLFENIHSTLPSNSENNTRSDDAVVDGIKLKREGINPICEGYLTQIIQEGQQNQKRVKKKTTRKKRRVYFVLEQSVLTCYQSEKKTQNALNTIALLGSCVKKLEEHSIVGEKHAFSVTLGNGSRSYILCSDTENERLQWFDLIKKYSVFHFDAPKVNALMVTSTDTQQLLLDHDLGNNQVIRTMVENIRRKTNVSILNTNMIKQKVSKKKRRFTEKGFDLDLTYITKRIIAMGFPSQSIESIYRNSMNDVRRFMDNKHRNHYRIYNLCSERSYNADKFHGNVVRFPFDDHNCPCFKDLVPLCQDMHHWLQIHPKNVCAIHCKAGKGRTGLVICAYLLFSKDFDTAHDALSFYARERTNNQEGVTIPSQRRYVSYFERLMRFRTADEIHIPDRGPLTFHKIVIVGKLRSKQFFDCAKIVNNGIEYTSRTWGKYWKQQLTKDDDGFLIQPPPQTIIPIHNDFKVIFYKTTMKKSPVWSFWANTCFLKDNYLELDNASLDIINKKVKVPFFKVKLFFNGHSR